MDRTAGSQHASRLLPLHSFGELMLHSKFPVFCEHLSKCNFIGVTKIMSLILLRMKRGLSFQLGEVGKAGCTNSSMDISHLWREVLHPIIPPLFRLSLSCEYLFYISKVCSMQPHWPYGGRSCILNHRAVICADHDRIRGICSRPVAPP